MADLDQLFGQIESKIKDEENGRWSYIMLKDVVDPQFDVKAAFPESTGHSKKYQTSKGSSVIYVHFNTAEEAEEAAKTQLDGVVVSAPLHEKRHKKQNNSRLLKPKPEGVVAKKEHGWKYVKDIKILIRRHIKSMQEKAPSFVGDLRASATIAREIKFLQAALRFLHTGSDIVTDQADYFENHEQGQEINYVKKARISLETQVQERIVSIQRLLQENKCNPRKQLAMKKLKKSYYCTEVLMRYFRGEKEPKIEPEILQLAEIKEEVLTDDEEAKQDSVDGDEPTQDSVDEDEPTDAKRPRKGRYFQI